MMKKGLLLLSLVRSTSQWGPIGFFPDRRSLLPPNSLIRLFAESAADDLEEFRAPANKMKLVGENLERQTYVYEVRLRSPLGIKLAEEGIPDDMVAPGNPTTFVAVQSLVSGASAEQAGLRRGDRIVATGAAIGGAMWEKRTLDGVTAAVQSRVRFGDVALRIERPFDNSEEVSWRSVVTETIVVDVHKPLGILLEERGQGDDRKVFVKQIEASGNAALSGKVKVDDRVVAVSASFGDGLWASRTIEGVVSAITTRIGNTVKLRLERQVRVGSWGDDGAPSDDELDSSAVYVNKSIVGGPGGEVVDTAGGETLEVVEGTAEAADVDIQTVEGMLEGEMVAIRDTKVTDADSASGGNLNGIGSAIESLEELQRTEGLTTNSTRAVLLERCCSLIFRYGRMRVPDAISKIDEVVAVLFKARVRPSCKFVNMGMTAYLKFRQPKRAVALYDGALALGFTPNMQCTTTLVRALTPSGSGNEAMSQRSNMQNDGSRLGDANSKAEVKVPIDSLDRVTAAMKILEEQMIRPDTYLLNQLMRAYSLNGLYSKAEDIFYRVMKAGGASQAEALARPCSPDIVSWNIMIENYGRQGRTDLAVRCFQDMLEQPSLIKPDKFTYTALLKSYIKVDDFQAAEQILDDMEYRAAAFAQSQRATNSKFERSEQNFLSAPFSSSKLAMVSETPPPIPDVFLYNAIVEGYSRRLRWREAESTVERMRARGLLPNAETYMYLVPCLIRAQHPSRAVDKLDDVRALGIRMDTEMYTMFITANAHEGDAVAALGLLKEMKNARVSASVQTFSAAMDACLRSDNPDLALALSAEMKRSGIEPDEVLYTMIVRAYGLKGEVRKAALLCASLQREAAEADAVELNGAKRSTGKSTGNIVRPTHILYDALLKEAVLQSSWAIAIGALSEIILHFYPSDATYSALCAEPLEQSVGDAIYETEDSNGLNGAVDPVSLQSMRSRFLFESINRIKESPMSQHPKYRLSGKLYGACLAVALADGSDTASDAAVSLIEARRRGEIRLRQRDEEDAAQAERPWVHRLGKAYSPDWDTVQLFKEIQ